MNAKQDIINVFGSNLLTFAKRSYKGALVFKEMMRGADLASEKMPIRLQIEVTEKCNHDCIMCNRRTRKHIGHTLKNDINYDVFEKLVKKINPFYITLNGLGEPLLNNEIDQIVTLCRQKMITSAMPCNLSVPKVLNSKIVKRPPDIITFSIHGASKEVFESISINSDYEKCIATMRIFFDLVDRKKTAIKILCALQAKNLFEYKKMYKFLREFSLTDDFNLVPVYDYGDTDSHLIIPSKYEKKKAIRQINKDISICHNETELRFYRKWKNVINEIKRNNVNKCKKVKAPCLIPWFSTYITATGNVLPCCFLTDENDESVMGNIYDSSFDAIWNGEQYKKFRKQLREDRENLNGCNYCVRDDSSRIKQYGLFFRRKMLWRL